jgi:uncharacterized protein (TIGR01777 family)
MNILIAGASGLVGKALVQKFTILGYNITVLGRDAAQLKILFPKHETLTWHDLPHVSAKKFAIVINLCGENIGAKRWNDKLKEQIIGSRVRSNQNLTDWILTSQAKPRFFSASAVGFYGLQSEDDLSTFTEDSSSDNLPINDFMREICVAWEGALSPLHEAGIPVTVLRFGVILDKQAGMIKKLLLPFSFGLGSILGSGQQIISWVQLSDVIAAFEFLLKHPNLTGAFNVCAPDPVTQENFAKTFARLLSRPLWLWLPKEIVQILFGEMGNCLLLSGQRVFPKRLLDAGFKFTYANLTSALKHTLSLS